TIFTEEEIKKLSEDKKECQICLESFLPKEECLFTPCLHLFHRKCLLHFLDSGNNMNCPICRYKIEGSGYNIYGKYNYSWIEEKPKKEQLPVQFKDNIIKDINYILPSNQPRYSNPLNSASSSSANNNLCGSL
ncbi:MAG: hypothetical protein MJ252_26950, partial [archaeon]|nr:hypothetical protein [archaeon]